MLVYMTATILTCALAYAYERRRDLKWLAVLAVLPLLAVSVARWNTGTDFRVTYLPLYRTVEQIRGAASVPVAEEPAFAHFVARHRFGKTNEQVFRHFKRVLRRCEPAYRAVMEVSVMCGTGYRAVQGFCAVLTLALVFTAIFRFSRWPSLAAFLFVTSSNYFLSLNIMRQYVAIAIGLVAVDFIVRRRPWLFLLCVAWAMSFHSSAWMLLPCYALSRVDLTPRRGLVLVVSALAFSLLATPVVRMGLVTVGARHYAGYFASRMTKDGFEWMFLAVNVCFLLVGARYWKRTCADNRLFACWYGMTVLGTCALAFSGAIPLMKRVNYYFAAPQFLMLPEIILSEDRPRLRRVFTVLVVLAFLAETAVAVAIMNKNGVLPYRWR